MRYGLDIPTTGEYAEPRKLADLAVDAEQAGWDGFFVWDALFAEGDMTTPIADPWIALAAIATRTERIRIGAFLTPLPRRHPWQVARQTVSLDHLSNGRLIFGGALGYQALDFTTFGEDFDVKRRAEKLDEGLEVLRGLWSGEAFTFHGTHYTVENAQFLPRPVQQPRIPVWLPTGWPRRAPLRRAARWDGVYVMTLNQETNEPLTSEETREIASLVTSYRANATDTFEIAVNGETPADPRRGAEIVQPYIEAGATWWLEWEASRKGYDAYRTRIRQGPPCVS
jgi:alkanesulfonate monooxygenase SsuD/methylene tetrahydromethanopterin reductase-like flavin-dependent oxidoreductase (luciferase family)